MTTRQWLVETENPHTVQVNHWSAWSGKGHKRWDTGLEHRFKTDGLPYIVRILYRTWCYEYELWVDGKLQ